MKLTATFSKNNQTYIADLSAPIDLSIPLHKGFGQVNAFHAPPFRVQPVKMGDFVGATKLGGAVNFMNVQLNPHGNGTHTECVGHISAEDYNVTDSLKNIFFLAEVISVFPTQEENGDKVIYKQHIEAFTSHFGSIEALIIRTLPNESAKKTRNYSGTNPPYIDHEAISFLVEKGIKHLLIDLPSVDKEQDDGKILAHKAFWNYPENPRLDATITELIFVPETVKDALYLLEIQLAHFEMDAAPSRPILFPIMIK